MKIKNNYEIRDLYIAAYLIASGYSMKDTSKYDGKTYFIFDESDEIQSEVGRFISRKALVEPIAFSEAIKSLKSVIYAVKDGNGYVNNGSNRK